MKFGYKAIVPHLKSILKQRKHIFDEYFTAEETVFVRSDGDYVLETLVWCHDLIGFAQTLALLRDKSFHDLVEKIGKDNGKGNTK